MYSEIIALPLFDETGFRYLAILLDINLSRRFSKISNWAHVCKNSPKTRVSVPTLMIVQKITAMICWMDVIKNIGDVSISYGTHTL